MGANGAKAKGRSATTGLLSVRSGGSLRHDYAVNMPTAPPDPELLAVFSCDSSAETPPYRQLHDSVVSALQQGRLRPGTRLPTVRALAAHLGLAANTVAAAYRALEQSGIIEGRGRSGTFVRLGDDPVEAEARRVALDAALRLRQLGVDRDRAIRYLTDAVDA